MNILKDNKFLNTENKILTATALLTFIVGFIIGYLFFPHHKIIAVKNIPFEEYNSSSKPITE